MVVHNSIVFYLGSGLCSSCCKISIVLVMYQKFIDIVTLSKITCTTFFFRRLTILYNLHICHLIQRHLWHTSQNLSSLTRRRNLWDSKGHAEYIPRMFEKQSWKEDEKTSHQYKIIRLRILFADNWSQKCANNISPFSAIHGIWNNAGFRHMAWFAVFPVIVHRRCVTL